MNEESVNIVLIGILLFLVIIYKLYRPRIKGKFGEVKISLVLKTLNSKKYKILNNVLIQNKYRSSQIDHIVVSTFGIFVIETKNYKGWIFGHENTDYWTQVIYRNKYKLRNPIIQSWGHIKTLKTVLKDFDKIQYFPIIVFTGSAKLKRITSSVPVIYTYQLLRKISKFSNEECLTKDEVEKICEIIIQLNSHDRKSRILHIKKAKSSKKNSNQSNICPRCGGILRLKDGKFGKFYGCSNYPKCNFSKNFKK